MGSGRTRYVAQSGVWGFFFFLAYVGAAIYFVQDADGSFWGVVLALLQAVVWPVYVVYGLLTTLGA